VGVQVGGEQARLPADLLPELREAFAREVASRLPSLRTAADGRPGPTATRDAHTLASSAAVVGEPELSRAARELEELLLEGAQDPAPAARRLVELLEPWVAS
jgi:HPt (histidine-containing phosphotransfer) domain-containing protein